MQEWIGGLLTAGGVACRLWFGKTWEPAASRNRGQAIAANAALILAGCGLYLLAGPLWSDAPVAEAGGETDSSFPVSFAATLLVLGVIFISGILFNRNKQSSC
ncbi:MAG: hypothetical protein ABS46_05910 [Cytophagaceae bacterium SCN 52-12]|nr:MAG: hypothetical protein ABS46_05910 [Cytophagaceae bacterium SCN 52-12]